MIELELLQLYRVVAGASLSGCGIFYVLGGVLCVGRLKRGALNGLAALVSTFMALEYPDIMSRLNQQVVHTPLLQSRISLSVQLCMDAQCPRLQ